MNNPHGASLQPPERAASVFGRPGATDTDSAKPTKDFSRAARRGPIVAVLTTMLLACASCPFAPAEPFSVGVTVPFEPSPWRDVFASLARRADGGDPQSARLALEMHRTAPQVYGQPLHATPEQLQRWHCRAHEREAPCRLPAAHA